MENKETLVIKKESFQSQGWRPIVITNDVYDSIQAISEETGLSKGKVAVLMLEFALSRTVIEK